MQCLLLWISLTVSRSVALPCKRTLPTTEDSANWNGGIAYTNSSTSSSISSVAIVSAVVQDPVNSYIFRGLAADVSQKGVSDASHPQSATKSIPSSNTFANDSTTANAAFFTAITTSNYPPQNNEFTATPIISAPAQAMSQVMQCWSDIATWRHQSASFWNAKVAHRTWPIASSWSCSTLNWTRTSTIYPSSVSTDSLCDGTPRAFSVSEAPFGFKPASGSPSLRDASLAPSSIEGGSDEESLVYQPTETQSFVYNPAAPQSAASTVQLQPTPPLDPKIATAAGFSILPQALSSLEDAAPVSTTAANDLPASSKPRITLTLTRSKVISTRIGDHSVLVVPGEESTVSATEPGIVLSDPVAGPAPTSSRRLKPTATRTEYVIAQGSLTLSATSVKGNSEAIQVGSVTLSIGGPAATVSGQVLTKGSGGIVLVPSDSAPPSGDAILAAGGYKVTAVILPGNHTVYDVGGITLSLGGSAAVIQDATFTIGPGGLGVIRPHTTTSHPTVLPPTTTVTRSRWSSTAPSATTASGGSGRAVIEWAQLVLLSGPLMCWSCI